MSDNTDLQTVAAHILLAHSDANMRRALHLLLAAHGHRVKAYAIEASLLCDPGLAEGVCLIAEQKQAHMDGIDLLRQLREVAWHGPAIMIASDTLATVEPRARAVGYAHVVREPFAHHVLLGLVDGLLAGDSA